MVAEIGLAVETAADIIRSAIGASAADPLGQFAGRPGLLIVDDLNGPPPDQEDALIDLFARLTAAGTKILLTAHAAFWLEGAEQIRLGGMTDTDLLAMLGDRLGADLDADTAQTWRPVLDLANGNPMALHILTDWCLALPEQGAPELRGLVDELLSGRHPPLPAVARPALETWPGYFIRQPDWHVLAVLLPFQRYASIEELEALGRPSTPDHLAEIEHVSTEQWTQLFFRLWASGLAWRAHEGYFELHPLFPAAVLAGYGESIGQSG